ncbi:hypothetical protein O988_06310, partial [Pseudogymnoascus sp. VKM F-3808]
MEMEESRSWREDLRDWTEAEREDAELAVDIVALVRVRLLFCAWKIGRRSCAGAGVRGLEEEDQRNMTSNPLTYEASAGETHMQVSSALPDEVIQCLRNARFLHLATCTTDLHPHVSLMNYTYLASTPFSPTPSIIMTTNPSSRKTHNLLSNPHVSLLVHDWVSHRPLPTASTTTSPEPEAPAQHRSSLATLLQNLNSSALSSISASINGDARVVESGTEEEKYLRDAHLRNNTFGEGEEGERQ